MSIVPVAFNVAQDNTNQFFEDRKERGEYLPHSDSGGRPEEGTECIGELVVITVLDSVDLITKS